MRLRQFFRRPLARSLFAIILTCCIALLRAHLLHGGGGDEFSVILENCQSDYLNVVGERFVQALEPPVDFGGRSASVSASIGIATYPSSGTDEQTLLARADTAMYLVKKSGKRGYKVWRP